MTVFGQTITEPFIIRDYYSFFNPAYTSYKSEIKASTYAKFRSHERISWNSNFEISIPNTNFSFGSNFHRDVIGQFWGTYTQINGAYLINFKKGDLIFGASSTIGDIRIGADWVLAAGNIDPAIRNNFSSPTNNKQGYLFNTLGVVYTFNKYHFGIAVDNIGGVLVYGENLTQKSKYYVNLSGGGELIRHETFDIGVNFL